MKVPHNDENQAHVVKPSRRLKVTSDPDDNIFLECAAAARADYLITGNLRHFPRFWKQTKAVSSREFLDLVSPHLFSR
jgi:predicted nucleic acid-binding protein